MRARPAVVLALAIVAGACASGDGSPSSQPEQSSSPVTATTTAATGELEATVAAATDPLVQTTLVTTPETLAGVTVASVVLAGEELVTAVADTAALRSRGLMGVTNLGALDGMLFVWGADTHGPFWMKDTLIALDIAWFDSDARFVSMLRMVPCGDTDLCPTYGAAAPYRYALEMPAGAMPDLDESSVLEFTADL